MVHQTGNDFGYLVCERTGGVTVVLSARVSGVTEVTCRACAEGIIRCAQSGGPSVFNVYQIGEFRYTVVPSRLDASICAVWIVGYTLGHPDTRDIECLKPIGDAYRKLAEELRVK